MIKNKYSLYLTFIVFILLGFFAIHYSSFRHADAAISPTAPPRHTAPDPSKAPVSHFSGPSQDGCGLWDQYFARTFYNTSDYDDVTYADFKPELDAIWNTGAPATNVAPDQNWSAKFDGYFYELDSPVIERVYVTFQGYAEVYINDTKVFSGINKGAPQEFVGTDSPVLDNINVHKINVRYVNDKDASARLTLKSETCWADDRTNCSSKELFYGGSTSAPSDTLYLTSKPQNTTGSVGDTVNFSVDYVSQPSATTQWQRKRSTEADFQDIGSAAKQLSYTVGSGDDNAQFRAQVTNSRCSLFDRLSSAHLTVSTSQSPTPTPTGSVTPTPCPSCTPTPTPTPTQSGTPTPTASPGGLSCSGPSSLGLGEEGTFTASGGRGIGSDPPKYYWAANFWTLDKGTGTPYKTKQTIATGNYEIKLTDGYSQTVCKVNVTAPTPTPLPAVTCVLEKSTIQPGEQAVLEGRGGDPFWYMWRSPNGTPPRARLYGDKYYETSYASPGTYTVTLENLNDKAECTVTVANTSPTPTPTDPACSNPDCAQDVNAFVYNYSPISKDDQGACFPSIYFPDPPGECNPHQAAFEPFMRINNWTKGLALGKDEPHGLEVVADRPDWTAEDALPDNNDLAEFRTNSFIDTKTTPADHDNYLMTLIGQTNAYRMISNAIFDFTNRVWERGAVSAERWYSPAELNISSIKTHIMSDWDTFLSFGAEVENNGIVLELSPFAALDKEAIVSTLYDGLLASILKKYNVVKSEKNLEEYKLLYALQRYFGITAGDDQLFIWDYTSRKKAPQISNLDDYDLSSMDSVYENRIAGILILMRQRFGEKFDKAVINSFIQLLDQSNSKIRGDVSLIQAFFIELYEYMDQSGYSTDDLNYFKNELIGQKAKIKIMAGTSNGTLGYQDIFRQRLNNYGDAICYTDGNGEQRPVVDVTIPTINAVGEKLDRLVLDLEYENSKNDVSETFNETSRQIFFQPTMHTPMGSDDFNAEILLPSNETIKKLSFLIIGRDFEKTLALYDELEINFHYVPVTPCK